MLSGCGFADLKGIARPLPTRRQSAPAQPAGMATKQEDIRGLGIVHAQYNTPIGMYSKDNIGQTFNTATRQLEEELNR